MCNEQHIHYTFHFTHYTVSKRGLGKTNVMNFNIDTARMSISNPPVHPVGIYPVGIPNGVLFDPDAKKPQVFS